MLITRQHTPEDLVKVAKNMREMDIKECYGISGHGPLEALMLSAYSSKHVSTVEVDGQPAGMFGVVEVDPRTGSVWFLGSDAVYRYTKDMLREADAALEEYHKHFDLLFNYCMTTNTKSIRWLKGAGFTFTQQLDNFGAGKVSVYEFCKLQTR